MSRIETLKQKVDALYQTKNPDRAEWADWLYESHVFLVADKAKEVAVRVGANAELAEAAGMLHDIADAVMKREDVRHEEESLRIAKEYLNACEFSDAEIVIVEDAILFHGCHDGKVPQILEGKAMATGDALVHLQSDFYEFAIKASIDTDPIEEIKEWGLKKIERDFNNKILFEDVREEARADYERLKVRLLGL